MYPDRKRVFKRGNSAWRSSRHHVIIETTQGERMFNFTTGDAARKFIQKARQYRNFRQAHSWYK